MVESLAERELAQTTDHRLSAGRDTPLAAPPLEPEAREKLPRLFGRYELRSLLGRGAMGAVYLAHDPQLERLVALKIPRPLDEEPRLWRDRFVSEARAAATLNHPNICPVFEVGQVDGQPYLTMAYIEGETLAARLRRTGPLPVPEAIDLVQTVSRAMAEAHERGIVHRDLKPANIMLDRRGQPVVMDFGLALRAVGTDDLRLTLSGVAMGTPCYMPPEQAGGDLDAIGPPADVYSLGVILYELVTGRVPFQARTFGKLLAQIERDDPPPAQSINPAVDDRLGGIIDRALAKAPEDRFASAAELAAALDAWQAGAPLPGGTRIARQLVETTDWKTPRASPPARRPRLWRNVALGALGVFLASLLGIFLYVSTDFGTLVVKLSDPAANVDVKVNGQEVVLEGGSVRIRPGANQTLEITGPGYKSISKSFDLKRGDKTVVSVTIEPSSPASPPTTPGDQLKQQVKVPPPTLKPVSFPEQHTLVEVPGWQILTDATKEQMQAWLDERKKAGHSVTWLDAMQVAEQPLFSAVAALDDRASDWKAFLDVECAKGEKIEASLAKVADLKGHRMLSISSYREGGRRYFVGLLQHEERVGLFGVDGDPLTLDQELAPVLKNGLGLRVLRPFLIEGGVVQYALYVERNPGLKTAYAHGMTASSLNEFLAARRGEGLGPTSLAAAPQDGQLLFSAAVANYPQGAHWEVDTDLTSQSLAARARDQVARGFTPQSVTAYPWDGAVRYCAIWVKPPPKPVAFPAESTLIELPGWQLLTDATQEQMQKWLDERKAAKHSVMWLDAVALDERPVLAGIAALDNRVPDWAAFIDLTGEEVNDTKVLERRFNPQGYVSTSVTGFVQGGNLKGVQVFHRGTTQALVGVPVMLTARQNLPKAIQNGFVVRSIRPFTAAGGIMFCGLNLEFEFNTPSRHGLDLSESGLAKLLEQNRQAGAYPTGVVPYEVNGLRQFAAAFRADPAKAPWQHAYDLTAEDLKAKAAELTAKGMTPVSINVYPHDGEVRYSVVWRQAGPEKQP